MEPVYCLTLLSSAQSNHKMQPFQGKTMFSVMKGRRIQNNAEQKKMLRESTDPSLAAERDMLTRESNIS